jgi:hypothetical protein
MLEEIIQSCCTGFGDCVTGYVSTYIFKKQIEKLYLHKEVKLSIGWMCVRCPYIKQEHMFRGRIIRRKMSHVNCLYSGTDGTLAFTNYYKSPKMLHDLHCISHLKLTINQYIGKCLIDEQTSRDEIKRLTFEAYDYFWNHVIDHSRISGPGFPLTPPIFNENLAVIYVRVGDQYLCPSPEDIEGPSSPLQSLIEYYEKIKDLKLPNNIALIGDVDNQLMNQAYQSVYGSNQHLVELSGSISHSVRPLQEQQWLKIFHDLYLMLYTKHVVILNNFSNFPRIVLFLKSQNKCLYFLKDDKILSINSENEANEANEANGDYDKSTLFAKHYQF